MTRRPSDWSPSSVPLHYVNSLRKLWWRRAGEPIGLPRHLQLKSPIPNWLVYFLSDHYFYIPPSSSSSPPSHLSFSLSLSLSLLLLLHILICKWSAFILLYLPLSSIRTDRVLFYIVYDFKKDGDGEEREEGKWERRRRKRRRRSRKKKKNGSSWFDRLIPTCFIVGYRIPLLDVWSSVVASLVRRDHLNQQPLKPKVISYHWALEFHRGVLKSDNAVRHRPTCDEPLIA